MSSIDLSTETRDQFERLLSEYQVKRALLVGVNTDSPISLAQHTCEWHFIDHEEEWVRAILAGEYKSIPRTDLTVLLPPDYLDIASVKVLVGVLRNTANTPVCVINKGDSLAFNDLIGFGFIRKFPQLFTYEIGKYNRTRDWNNSRYWANPEMFDKYRW